MFVRRIKRKLLSRVHLLRFIILLTLIVVAAIIYVLLKQSHTLFSGTLRSTNSYTHIAILGIRGESNDSPNLTDTILLLSLSRDKSPSVVAIPRDLWLPSLGAKINSSYQSGLEKSGTKGGLVLAKSAVSEITGQPVHYAVVINFSFFKQFIDLLGGIDVQVERTFDDFKFPISGKENDLCDGDPQTLCRYEHLHFEAGSMHMDGNTALKYVRSRQSSNPDEGTDYARSRRQSAVVTAIRNRLLSRSLFTYPHLLSQIYSLASSSILTDLSSQEYFAFFRLLWHIRQYPLRWASLVEPDQLFHPPISSQYGFQWVLIPKDNDLTNITNFVSAHLQK